MSDQYREKCANCAHVESGRNRLGLPTYHCGIHTVYKRNPRPRTVRPTFRCPDYQPKDYCVL